MIKFLFLATLFLYPFSVAGHSLYMIPQVLLVGLLFLEVLRDDRRIPVRAVYCVLLAFVAGALAFAREISNDPPEFSEPAKLAVNIVTVLLFSIRSTRTDFSRSGSWLTLFGLIWLLTGIASYVLSGASSLLLLVSIASSSDDLASSTLYSLARPLEALFLTKNILAMYGVAVFGAVSYFQFLEKRKTSFLQKAIFFLFVGMCFSRQALLSFVAMVLVENLVHRRRILSPKTISVGVIGLLIIGIYLMSAFNFSNSRDGASERLVLWQHFFDNVSSFYGSGLGVGDLNAMLFRDVGIDNYHMFFMNQIAAYGIVHCMTFNALLWVLVLISPPPKGKWLVVTPYWLNVTLQTYGYEYGNLFLFCILVAGHRDAALAIRNDGGCKEEAPSHQEMHPIPTIPSA